MRRILMPTFLALAVSGAALYAWADAPVSQGDAQKIEAAIKPWGCSGGKMERETEASGIFEVDDAKCPGGQYDIRLDKDFKVITITRD